MLPMRHATEHAQPQAAVHRRAPGPTRAAARTRHAGLAASLLVSPSIPAARLRSLRCRSSQAVPAESATKQGVIADTIDFLRDELPRLFSTGKVTEERYAEDIHFSDPMASFNNRTGYVLNVKALATLFRTSFELFEVSQSGPTSIHTRWTLSLTPKVALILPWNPQAVISGVSDYEVDAASGLITRHVDKWDALPEDNILSGLRYVLGSFAQVQLTPELGTPTYSVLFKKDAYEVRRYEAYNVAETSMGAGAGPAAGTGFTELAGYIFGGNDAEKKMDMTTPVFSTGGGGAGGSRMQFVLESGVEPSAFPAPKSRDVERRSEAGGLRAVASFSGLPTDGEVVEAEKALRAALERDGMEPEEGYVLARYNEPYVLPPVRRNEVMIALPELELAEIVRRGGGKGAE